MSSSAPDPRSPAGDSTGRVDKPVPPKPDLPDRALLENVLEQTLMTEQVIESLDSEELAAVRALVQRRRGEPFGLDPIVVDLVEVVLRSQFKNWSGSLRTWTTLCGEIARTLFEDPIMRGRLEALWSRLCTLQP